MSEEFISEAIKPVAGTFNKAVMATGEPGAPSEFTWRGKTFIVKKVIRSWKKTAACTHGSGEQYVNKHYYEILTQSGERMKIYFERRPPRNKPNAPRWWLYTKEKCHVN